MHILILNWRDIKNPHAGGAEVLTHEISKRLIEYGHRVTLVSQSFSGALSEEIIDGVNVIRRGSFWSVHMWAFVLYFTRFSKKIDCIVDEIHWFPFFSVLYSNKPVIFLVCEVAGPLFFRLFPAPVAYIARFFEKVALFCYRKCQVVAISRSTKEDLIREGFLSRNITIVSLGINIPKTLHNFSKEPVITIIYVGRINKLKGIEDAIQAFFILHQDYPNWKFWIVGRGEKAYVKTIEKMLLEKNLHNVTKIYGYVSEIEKFELLTRAHLLIAPSFHEGWGLMVTEAAAVGTPAVGYRSGALRESIIHNKTGILVKQNTPSELAKEIENLGIDMLRYKKYRKNAKNNVKNLSWDVTAAPFVKLISSLYE